MGSSSLPAQNNSHLQLCTKREIHRILPCPVLFVQSQNHLLPTCPFWGGVSRCAPAGSPWLALEVLPPMPSWVSDILPFPHCSKGAQLDATCASVPCLLLRGRKTRCSFKWAASQLLREGWRWVEAGKGQHRVPGDPCSPDFTKCSLRIVSKNNLDISKKIIIMGDFMAQMCQRN